MEPMLTPSLAVYHPDSRLDFRDKLGVPFKRVYRSYIGVYKEYIGLRVPFRDPPYWVLVRDSDIAKQALAERFPTKSLQGFETTIGSAP